MNDFDDQDRVNLDPLWRRLTGRRPYRQTRFVRLALAWATIIGLLVFLRIAYGPF